MYHTIRFDADPTSWELTKGIEQVPAFDAPVVLPVYHPLLGELVLSPRSVGSVVFLDYLNPLVHGTRINGYPITVRGEGALYLPSPVGPQPHMIPPNIYPLDPTEGLAALKAKIIAAMTNGTLFPVKIVEGEVVINGAEVPFAVLCPPNPNPA